MSEKTLKPVLTLTGPDGKTEIFLLNVGTLFPLFGGSSRGLMVGENQKPGKRTASLIMSRTTPMGRRDTELNLDDPGVWTRIAELINTSDHGNVAESPKVED